MDLRAVLVDDEQLARDELGYLLGQIGGVEVLGQAGNGIEVPVVQCTITADVDHFQGRDSSLIEVLFQDLASERGGAFLQRLGVGVEPELEPDDRRGHHQDDQKRRGRPETGTAGDRLGQSFPDVPCPG